MAFDYQVMVGCDSDHHCKTLEAIVQATLDEINTIRTDPTLGLSSIAIGTFEDSIQTKYDAL